MPTAASSDSGEQRTPMSNVARPELREKFIQSACCVQQVVDDSMVLELCMLQQMRLRERLM